MQSLLDRQQIEINRYIYRQLDRQIDGLTGVKDRSVISIYLRLVSLEDPDKV